MSGRYWILTIPHEHFTPYLPANVAYSKGQLETGENGFLHWQLIAAYSKTVRLSGVRATYGPYHAELCRSNAAEDYVWKEETRVAGTQFELGAKALKRNNKRDWDEIRELLTDGRFCL